MEIPRIPLSMSYISTFLCNNNNNNNNNKEYHWRRLALRARLRHCLRRLLRDWADVVSLEIVIAFTFGF